MTNLNLGTVIESDDYYYDMTRYDDLDSNGEIVLTPDAYRDETDWDIEHEASKLK